MSIQILEQAVSDLSERDLSSFREWFEEFDSRQWDEQFERDAKSGKLDALAKQAINDFKSGNFREL